MFDSSSKPPLDYTSRGVGGLLPAILVGGGVAALAMSWLASRRIDQTEASTSQAVSTGGTINLRLTTYWPKTASEAERKMEGGVEGAAIWRGKKAIDPTTGKRPVLYTLEEHLAGKAPYVSLSGDPEAWPFGQRIQIDAFPKAVFRVTDTGGNFKGTNKMYRATGYEPLDVCVLNKSTKVPSEAVGRIVKGDTFAPGEIAASAFKGQSVVVGADPWYVLGASDVDAVAVL